MCDMNVTGYYSPFPYRLWAKFIQFSSLFGGLSAAYKRKGESLSTFYISVQELIVAQMSTPEMPPKKRKELEDCDEENSKKSKIECSDTLADSPGQDKNDTEDNHLIDETLADTKSEEAKEVDKVQVEWIYNKYFFEIARFSLFRSPGSNFSLRCILPVSRSE